MFGTDLAGEYLLAHEGLGLSIAELRRLAANSFRASFQGRTFTTEPQRTQRKT
jgi:adenosine deaminase